MSWQTSTPAQVSHLRRTTFYPPTGTGRDSYIMVNNGGTSAPYKLQGVPTHGNFMKFGRVQSQTTRRPTSSNKHQKYTANGTGRDNYITYEIGYFRSYWDCNGTENQKVGMFRSTFRDGNNIRTTFGELGGRRNPEEQQGHVRRLSLPRKREEKYLEKVEDVRRRLKGEN